MSGQLTADLQLRLTDTDLSGGWLLRLKAVAEDPIVWQTSHVVGAPVPASEQTSIPFDVPSQGFFLNLPALSADDGQIGGFWLGAAPAWSLDNTTWRCLAGSGRRTAQRGEQSFRDRRPRSDRCHPAHADLFEPDRDLHHRRSDHGFRRAAIIRDYCHASAQGRRRPRLCREGHLVTTPNLAITHILQSQAQKEVTANAAFDAFDNSNNRAVSLDLGDADLTLVSDQANRNGLIIFTGALTAARTVTLPANHRRGAGGGNGGVASALNDLIDVNATAAVNGDLLRFDGSLWKPDAGGVHTRIPLPYKDALLQRSTDLTDVSFPILVPFQNTVYDTDAFWDASNPSRLTIPTGVIKVRLQGSLSLKPSATTGGVFISFEKNGAGSAVGSGVFAVRQGTSGYTNNDFAANTAVIPITAGDYFVLRVNSTSSS